MMLQTSGIRIFFYIYILFIVIKNLDIQKILLSFRYLMSIHYLLLFINQQKNNWISNKPNI
jgi:hypothetical protein